MAGFSALFLDSLECDDLERHKFYTHTLLAVVEDDRCCPTPEEPFSDNLRCGDLGFHKFCTRNRRAVVAAEDVFGSHRVAYRLYRSADGMDDVHPCTHFLHSSVVDTHCGREGVDFAKKGDTARSVQVRQCQENQGHRPMVVSHKDHHSVFVGVGDHGRNSDLEGNVKKPVWL